MVVTLRIWFEFPRGSRYCSQDLHAQAARSPAQTFPALKTLLGQSFDSDAASEFSKLYPANKLVKTERNSIAFEHAGGVFTVEELVAMELINIRKNAELMADGRVRDTILTVPPFYNQAQRLAILDAAKLAGLRPIELMNDGVAVALDYAKARTFDEPQNHIIFDMGAGSTTATIVKLATKSVKDVGRFNKTVTTVDVLGTGYDTTASGNTMTERLFNYLISEFDAKHSGQASTKISDNSRATARLLKEATRIKQVLSANHEAMVSVESLHEDIDFRLKLTRVKFEELTSDLAPLSTKPVTDALSNAGLNLDDISSLILHGGAARVPFVQKALLEVIEEGKIARNVNADEAAVMGAVFRGAALSGSFRVKEVLLQDISTSAYSYSTSQDAKLRGLFSQSSPLGSEKNITFPDQLEDFVFEIAYDQLDEHLSSARLASVHISGVSNTTSSLTKEFACNTPVVTVSVVIDPSGLIRVPASFAVCEVQEKQGVADKVKGWFGGKDNASSSSSVTTSSPVSKASSEPTINTVKKRSDFHIVTDNVQIHTLDDAELKDSLAKIKTFEDFDNTRIARETARNALEAYIYKIRDFLESEGFLEVSSTAEQDELRELASSCNEWMYGEGENAAMPELVAKKKDMTAIADPIRLRQKELTTREDKINELQKQISSSRTFLRSQFQSLKEFATKKAELEAEKAAAADKPKMVIQEEDDLDSIQTETSEDEKSSQQDSFNDLLAPAYTEEELKKLETKLDETERWLTTKSDKQKELSKTDDPVLLTADLKKKIDQVSEDFMSILMKASYRQQSKPKAKAKSKTAAKDKKTKSSSKSKTSSEEPLPTDTTSDKKEDASKVDAEAAAAPADAAHVDIGTESGEATAAEPEPQEQPDANAYTRDEL